MYMNEFVVPEAMAISKRIELVTNFQLSTKKFGSENFQIMNYGLGGMISGHVDSHGAVFNENGHDQDHKSKNKRPKSFTSVKADLHSRQKDRHFHTSSIFTFMNCKELKKIGYRKHQKT